LQRWIFSTVPTLTFGVLYYFFVIGHDRRRILHHDVTLNPNALWIELQLHEAWECGEQQERFLIFDRDAKFSADVVSTVKAMGGHPNSDRLPQSLADREGHSWWSSCSVSAFEWSRRYLSATTQSSSPAHFRGRS
jgi:hypothetical protein